MCHQLYHYNHCTEFTILMLIFSVLFWGLIAWKKFGLFAFLGLFGPFSLFSFYYFFFLILIFLVFQIFNDVKNFSYTMYLKGEVKTFNLTTFWNSFRWYEVKIWYFNLFSIFFNFLLAFVSQAVSFQPLGRIHFSNAYFFRFFED